MEIKLSLLKPSDKRLPDCPEKEYEFYCLLLADYWKYRNMITKKLLPEPINWDTTVDGYTKVDKVIRLDHKCSDQLPDKMENYHLAYALFELKDF